MFYLVEKLIFINKYLIQEWEGIIRAFEEAEVEDCLLLPSVKNQNWLLNTNPKRFSEVLPPQTTNLAESRQKVYMLHCQLWEERMFIIHSVLIAITFLFAVLSKSIKLLDFAYEDEMELKDYLIVETVYWPVFSLRTK